MNVSFTRARSKLIVFGSRNTLQSDPLLSEFFTLMETQNWILSLPVKAVELHVIPSRPKSSPGKRAAEDVDGPSGCESMRSGSGRLMKRAKAKKSTVHDALLKGRPILKDLVNNER